MGEYHLFWLLFSSRGFSYHSKVLLLIGNATFYNDIVKNHVHKGCISYVGQITEKYVLNVFLPRLVQVKMYIT